MKLDPNSWEYKKRTERMLRTHKLFCNDCKKDYTLGEPCIHHCSDSPEHRIRYKELLKKQRKSKEVVVTNTQKDLYYQGDIN